MSFEWDPKKNELNIVKHGIDFEDAMQVFHGPCLERVDERFDHGEERFVVFGEMGPHIVAVVYVWRRENRRLISARKATKAETRAFFEVIYGKQRATDSN